MVKETKRLALGLTLISLVTLALATGTALASSNSVHVAVPYVTVKTGYTIAASGSAAGTKQLYMFIDSKRCGANPHVEFKRTGKFGTAFGYYWHTVSGGFSETAGFKTLARIKDHACVYLTKSSAPKNSRGGVVARAFKTYTVHRKP